MGEGLPTEPEGASVRWILLKNASPVGVPNLLGVFSATN